MNTNVSPESHEGWHAFAREHGVTVAALIEVIGRELAGTEPLGNIERIVRQAREIDYERRAHRGRKPDNR